jgi:thiamine biosynthesis lipoprotein
MSPNGEKGRGVPFLFPSCLKGSLPLLLIKVMDMRRLAIVSTIVLVPALFLTACRAGRESGYQKYSDGFFDTFDTLVNVTAYVRDQEEFETLFDRARTRFNQLHRLFDIYYSYEGINNIKTVNDNAGVKPVEVDREIIDLILFAKEWYDRTDGKVNIALGSVLKIWHSYRQQGLDHPANAKLPPMEKLKEAAEHTDIDKVIVDEDKGTVYLEDPGMSLDVGAVAKGFAAEIVARELMAEGLKSGIINAGGNMRIIGKPLDGIRGLWGIGIQDPDKFILSDDYSNLLDIVFVKDTSVVSSGVYQRYYVVDDIMYHHLIDPDTLMPGEHNKAVTVVTEDSGLADLLSTVVFLMPYQRGREFVESLDDVDAVWVMEDGRVEATDGMKRMLKSYGAGGELQGY